MITLKLSSAPSPSMHQSNSVSLLLYSVTKYFLSENYMVIFHGVLDVEVKIMVLLFTLNNYCLIGVDQLKIASFQKSVINLIQITKLLIVLSSAWFIHCVSLYNTQLYAKMKSIIFCGLALMPFCYARLHLVLFKTLIIYGECLMLHKSP